MMSINKSIYLRMFEYESWFKDFKDNELIKLESMDYDTFVFKMPKIYKKAIDFMFEYNTLTYSDFGGFPRLIKEIKDYENTISNTQYDSAVFVSAGVSSLLNSIIKVINKNTSFIKNEVIIFSPEYSLFHSVIENNSLTPIIINATRSNNFLVTFEQIKEKISDKTMGLMFSNPNNPTCQQFSKKFVEKLVNICKENNVAIISDEIYRETLYNGKKYFPIEKINGGYKNLFKVFGPSKDRPGLTGIRMGYCIFDKKYEQAFKKSQIISNFSNNIIADFLFLIDISIRNFNLTNKKSKDLQLFSNDYIDDYNNKIKQNKNLQKEFNNIALNQIKRNRNIIDYVKPEGGNSIWFKYKDPLQPDKFVKKFISKGIAIYGGDVFMNDCELNGAWSRICITKNISYIINGIKKI